MNKLIIILLCLLSSAVVNAEGECDYLHINIKNVGKNRCVLKNKQVLYGKLFFDSKLPEILLAEETAHIKVKLTKAYSNFFELILNNKESHEGGVVLTYQCGDKKAILLSRFPGTNRNPVLESRNMQVTYRIKEPFCMLGHGKPAVIDWDLIS